MHVSFLPVTAAALIATADAIFSNVEITKFDQSGLGLAFKVSWDTEREDADSSTAAVLVDMWLLTRQPDPSSWMEISILQGVENSGSVWVDVGSAWAARGSWDDKISGEATVCIYNSSKSFDSACAEPLGIVPASEAPIATAGEGISNVNVPHLAQQEDSIISFSVTWADGGGARGIEDTTELVDIWLTAKQTDPPAWVEIPLQEDVENTRLAHMLVVMDWDEMGWDVTRGGEVQICIYDSLKYGNNGCSIFVAFESPFSGNNSEDSKEGDSIQGAEDSDDADADADASGSNVGTILSLLFAGGVFVGLTAWLAVSEFRRRQRIRWIGAADEAETLPDEVFIRPINPYSSF